METEKVICDHAAMCRAGGGEPGCCHNEPHERKADCYDPCYRCGERASCVPRGVPETPEPNYRRMWKRLDSELRGLELGGVRSIDPILVRRFMAYIQQTEVK